MIPTIGIMIGGYIVLRCIDIFCRPLSAFSSRSAQTFELVAAMLIILATLAEMADLASLEPAPPSNYEGLAGDHASQGAEEEGEAEAGTIYGPQRASQRVCRCLKLR